jgi:branched-chain amino acid transport system ATP-binding protein
MLLKVSEVTVQFGGVTAVADLSLEIGRGELIGIIGPNGAGKTTLMRVITGMVRPTSGRVLLKGADITGWTIDQRVRSGLALAQQIVKPLATFTLAENVALACGSRRMGSPWRAMTTLDRQAELEQAKALLELVGIGAAAHDYPSEVPLGYLKCLELARALALEPDLILLDEPLAGLNQAEAAEMADRIASLVTDERSIILIEHNLREVVRICPRLLVQDHGRNLDFGPTQQVMANPKVRAAYLGEGAG